MPCLRQIQKSATVTFAPHASLIATGSVSGAVDASFSTDSTLQVLPINFESRWRNLVCDPYRPPRLVCRGLTGLQGCGDLQQFDARRSTLSTLHRKRQNFRNPVDQLRFLTALSA